MTISRSATCRLPSQDEPKIGDMVICKRFVSKPPLRGLVVGYNKKGEGGQDFVHVLIDGEVSVFMHFDVEVINENR